MQKDWGVKEFGKSGGSHGHACVASRRAGKLWDMDAGRWPVEGLRHGHVDAACGTRLFLPQPLLHALKHSLKEIIACVFEPRLNIYDFTADIDLLHWWQQVISYMLTYSKYAALTLTCSGEDTAVTCFTVFFTDCIVEEAQPWKIIKQKVYQI